MEAIINELSLSGQYDSIEKFAESVTNNTLGALKLASDHDVTLLKKYDLYNRNVTEANTLQEALLTRGYDSITRFKALLLNISMNPPYWEEEQQHTSSASYKYNDEEVTNSSIAEAYERECALISFENASYLNNISVTKDESQEKEIFNVINKDQMVEIIRSTPDELLEMNPEEFLNRRYLGTKLSFECFPDCGYGLTQLEKRERKVIIDSFDKFVQRSWEEILADRVSFKYKRYQPSSRDDNWFKNTDYEDKKIDKFRCGDTHRYCLRCFGYREGDIFYPLRIEKGHDVSDNG